MQKIQLDRRLLRSVEAPARYLGGEWNMVQKSDRGERGEERIHFAFCFPDIYEVGMSNLALRIIYGLLNKEEDVYCERIFAPAPDMRQKMLEQNIPLFSVDTQRAAADFDILGFTLQYELSYPTILDMLSLAGVPVWQKERKESDPLLVAGGPCVFNSEPVADFFDLIMIGEGEEVLLELMEAYRLKQKHGLSRQEFLRKAAEIPGIYVPSLYEASYDEDGSFLALEAREDGVPRRVRKRIIRDLNQAYVPDKPLVPNIKIVHDRVFLELFRGCANGCRFCQAGMIYRPVRERSVESLRSQVDQQLTSSGYEEIGLLSLSTGDYSRLHDLCQDLLDSYQSEHVNLSLPSLRLDSVSIDLLNMASQTRKSGLTFAPEAGSQQLRDGINKNILRSDLLQAAQYAFELGWDRIKLYFMLGLPGETDEDITAIADLCYELVDLWQATPREGKRRRLQIVVSTSFFIPKPWTPFQWEGQIRPEEMQRKQELLAKHLRSRFMTYQWHDFESSVIEAALAKGDRRMAHAIYRVHSKGAFAEGEKKFFSFERWLEAFKEADIDWEHLVFDPIPEDAALPWEVTDAGVKKEFLLREKHKSERGESNPGCLHSCSACGAAEFASGICRERGVV